MSFFNDILDEAARSSAFQPDASFLARVWGSLVPDEISRHTSPAGWEDGVLTVEVSPSWLPEIRRQRLVLLRRIDERLPWKVADLILVEGEPSLPESAAPPSPVVEESPVAVERFEDDELNRLAGMIMRHVRNSETK